MVLMCLFFIRFLWSSIFANSITDMEIERSHNVYVYISDVELLE